MYLVLFIHRKLSNHCSFLPAPALVRHFLDAERPIDIMESIWPHTRLPWHAWKRDIFRSVQLWLIKVFGERRKLQSHRLWNARFPVSQFQGG